MHKLVFEISFCELSGTQRGASNPERFENHCFNHTILKSICRDENTNGSLNNDAHNKMPL